MLIVQGFSLNRRTYLSHLDPGVVSDRIHFALAVAQAAQAAPHFAAGSLGLPALLE